MKYTGTGWVSRELSTAFIGDLKEIAAQLLTVDGFQDFVAVRHEASKSELTKSFNRISTPDQILVGAGAIDNFAFNKYNGENQGTLILFKDKIVFVSSIAFTLQRFKEYGSRTEDKRTEMDEIWGKFKEKALANGFRVMGYLDSFAIEKSHSPTKTNVESFLNEVKRAGDGFKLRIRS